MQCLLLQDRWRRFQDQLEDVSETLRDSWSASQECAP